MTDKTEGNVVITSDGGVGGTKVVTKDGRDLTKFVQSVSFDHKGGELPVVTLKLMFCDVGLEGRAIFYGPAGKAIRRIEYHDDTDDVFGAP